MFAVTRLRDRVRDVLLVACALTLLAGADPTPAQFLANGPQFQVNDFTSGFQVASSVAMHPNGAFVVVWNGEGSWGTDTNGRSVQLRRFTEKGEPGASDQQVNTYTTSNQVPRGVVSDPLGGFVVVWDSFGSAGTDSDGWSVHARRYDALGDPTGDEFQVNTFTSGWQQYSAVGVDGDGDTLVVWTSDQSAGADTDRRSIQAQGFDAAGNPLGAQFQVNTYTTGEQGWPRVAGDSAGRFVVVWESRPAFGTLGTTVRARRVLADGTPLGAEFQVNSYTVPAIQQVAVAADGVGRFIVAWTSQASKGSDTDGSSVQARRYDADGVALAKQFQVNTYTSGDQTSPAVAADSHGDFVVGWADAVPYGMHRVRGQRYRDDGTTRGGPYVIDANTSTAPNSPAIAMDSGGDFVVTWTALSTIDTEVSLGDVQAQRFDGVFRDDFDAGSTSRWSAIWP